MYNNTIIDNAMMITTGFGLSEEEMNILEVVYFWGEIIVGYIHISRMSIRDSRSINSRCKNFVCVLGTSSFFLEFYLPIFLFVFI